MRKLLGPCLVKDGTLLSMKEDNICNWLIYVNYAKKKKNSTSSSWQLKTHWSLLEDARHWAVMVEWLRHWTRNPMGFARAGSNPTHSILLWASLVGQLVKNPPAMWETWVQSLDWEDPLDERKGLPTPVFWPGVTKSQTRLCNFHFSFRNLYFFLNAGK